MMRIENQVFLKNDLENMLHGLDMANAPIDDMRRPEGALYRLGFHDALRAVAAAIGGELASSGPRVRVIERQMIDGGNR